MDAIYLDNQSNTKLDERVFVAMLPYFKDNYGNPQSMYSLGAEAKNALDAARLKTAALIGAQESEIVFVSCGSEANNLAVKGAATAAKARGRHIIVSAIEHFSVLQAAKRLSQEGFEVTEIPVDRHGLVSLEDVAKAVRPDTILVSIQHANTEIGTIQPIEEIGRVIKEKNVLFHTDAVCTAGTIPLDVKKVGADLLTLSGSQFYGPKGAAALYIRKGVRVTPQIDGGIQEGGKRSGTENLPAIVGLGKACEIARNEMASNAEKMVLLRNRLIGRIPEKIEHVYLNGHPEKRLPGNVNFSVEFIEGEGMFLLLDLKGIMASSGSACASKALKMSHVLTATGVDAAVGQGSLLFTLSRHNTPEDVDYVLAELPAVVDKLRAMSPLYAHFKKTGQRRDAGPGTDYEHEHAHEEN
ncbi:MAG: cysteine desulfurase [Endomicrobiales bacterium]|nr:cysteine desulfurase [Endomicrobiales bacterium]